MTIDVSGFLKVRLDNALIRSKQLELGGNAAEAAAAWTQAATLMQEYAALASTKADAERRMEKARLYLQHAADLKQTKRRPAPMPPEVGPDTSSGTRDTHTGSPAETPGYAREIASLIHRSPVTWDRIGGLEETKREIKFTYGLALAKKPQGVRFPGWRRMLFYGPPGTGKTLLAAATSNGLGATFFNVKVSSILSKYFGESSKLVTALFDAARDAADEGFAVVFVDEIESIAMARGDGNDSGAERRVLSTLLSELDGLVDKGGDNAVLTIAATNAPWDLDDAVLSRFQKRIYIPLPDEPARRSILEIQLCQHGHQLEFPVDRIVARTEWFSGRDLERLSNQAVNTMVEEMNLEVPALVDRGRDEIEKYSLKTRPLKEADFTAAFQRIRVDVPRYKQLAQQFSDFAANN